MRTRRRNRCGASGSDCGWREVLLSRIRILEDLSLFLNLSFLIRFRLMGKGAQTRDAVLQAAIGRFGRDGYRATSVADIARDAGVGSTVPYAYFSDKEALFLAAVDEDAAGVIEQGLSHLLGDEHFNTDWRQTLIFTLVQ